MSPQLKRRAFIALLGSAAAAWPLAVQAQEPGRTYRLGFLNPSPRHAGPMLALFDELRLNGFIEGQNLEVLPGGFEVGNDNLAELAAALVRAAPDAIIAGPALPLRALQAVTRAIPLIGMSEDMVAEGLAISLAHPGGNITGISLLSPELDGKRQEILITAVPNVRRIAAMADSKATPPHHLQALQHGVRSRGVELVIFGVLGWRRSRRQLTLRKHRGRKGSIFWHLRCSRFRAHTATVWSWIALRPFACRQFFNGRRRRKQVRLPDTVRVSVRYIVSAPAWS